MRPASPTGAAEEARASSSSISTDLQPPALSSRSEVIRTAALRRLMEKADEAS